MKLRTQSIGWLVCLAGIGAIVSALAAHSPAGVADLQSGLAKLHFGLTQWLASLYGAGVLAVGILISTGAAASESMALRWRAALLLAVWSATLTLICMIWPRPNAEWVLLGYVAAIAVLLPLQLGILALVSVGGLHLLLTWISSAKSGLTGLPLTVLDMKIALASPSALWDALGLPDWLRYLTVAFIGAVLLMWALALLVAASRLARRRHATGGGHTFVRVICVGVIGLLILGHLGVLYGNAAKDQSTWYPARLTRLAHRMGILPFLAYSYRLESQSTGDIYRTDSNASPPSAEEVRVAVLNYMDFDSSADSKTRLLPNIVVVLAESTFDPGAVFRLDGVWNDRLFRPGPRTAASGLLRVNAVGGGTWISEFETIVGLDSRLFGYSGMYTHASLSPFINVSLATYLRDYGYRTLAFFPNHGDFYNARNAYERYGFERILDSDVLGDGEWIEDDRAIAASVQKAMGLAPDAPFFGYVLFLENHSPHDCHGADPATFSARFADTSDFVPNCALHDYLRRLGSTNSAIESLVDYLAGVETRSGRPFVLMVFGDHQPFTFTDTGDVQYDYRTLRRDPDNIYTTFFHILSSSAVPKIRCCSVAVPAAVLPTLLSGFIAPSPDDIYLGINLWLYARCGSDAIRADFGDSMEALELQTADVRTDDCKLAYERAVAGFHASGIFSLGDE